MAYSSIFKFAPSPGLLFAEFVVLSRYGKSGLFALGHDNMLEVYAKKSDERKINKFGLNFFSNPVKYRGYKKQILDFLPSGEAFFQEISRKKWQEMDDESVRVLFEKSEKIFINFLDLYFMTEFFCFDGIEKSIKDWFNKNFSPDEFASKWNMIITSTPGHVFHSQENISEAKKKLEKIIDEKNQEGELFEGGDKPELSKDLENLVDTVREMQAIKYQLRVFLNQFFWGTEGAINIIVGEIGRRKNLSQNQIHYLTASEIMDLFSDKPLVSPAELSKRQRNFVYRRKFGRWQVSSGREARELTGQIVIKHQQTDLIRGSVANFGHAVGLVKVIRLSTRTDLVKEEVTKMKEGQILVADTTGPELILACRKASAIVTSEGGINSHAAIISRELKIPCIVGTKIAADILKDGDLVEVDANKGIVKIIKKAE